MKNNQRGFIVAAAVSAIVIFVLGLFWLAIFTRWEVSEDNVSGIVYNTTNNGPISGNTNFSIRASESTYTTEKNKSSYCLPPNSPYKDLVNKAAGDKRIKVHVTTKKGFWVKAPWTCVDNVTVEEVK